MKRLVLAEKPSVARDIARVLGCKKQTKELYRGRQIRGHLGAWDIW